MGFIRNIVFFVLILGLFLTASQAADELGSTVERAGVVFRVWAPNASSVEVIGDFNNWKSGKDPLLKKTGGIWEGTVKRAKSGQAYKYLINGELRKRDPYGRQVSAGGDQTIIYDHSDYNWKNDKSPKYDISELVIYEMHIGAFNDPHSGDGTAGTFDDAIKRLPELQELGINCIQLMPVHEYDGQSSWGYNPSDLFAVESAYGGPEGLKEFVRACHSRGMVVHLDVVHNHYGPQNLDLIQFDGTGGMSSGGIYFYEGPEKGVTPWGPRVKFDDAMVRRFIQDNIIQWIKEFNIDGFRWDSTVNIRAYNNGASPLPEGLKMLNDINDTIHRQYPGVISIAEDSLDIGNFDGSWEYDFHHHLMPLFTTRNDQERDMQAIANVLTRYPSKMHRIIYTDNHDEAGKMNGEMRIASDIDPITPNSDYARRLSGLSSLITLTAPGVPLLLQGNEMLEPGTFHDDIPINWNNWRKYEGFVRFHRDLIHLRRNLEGKGQALQGLEVDVAAIDNDRKTIVYWRWNKKNRKDIMVVAINFSGVDLDLDIPFPRTGKWDLLAMSDWQIYGGQTPYKPNESFNLTKSKLPFPLPSYSAAIFGSQDAAMASRPVDRQIRAVASESEQKTAAPSITAPARKRPEDCFSMFKGVIVKAQIDGVQKKWPMELFNDNQWECFVKLDETDNLKLNLVNDDESITWGGEGHSTLPASVTLTRNSSNQLQLATLPSGWYRVGFNEESRELDIDHDAFMGQVNRTWTLLDGTTFTGKLIAASHTLAMFTLESGDAAKIRIHSLAIPDQERVFSFIFNQWAP